MEIKIQNSILQHTQLGKQIVLGIRCKCNFKRKCYKPVDFLHCVRFLWGIISVL